MSGFVFRSADNSICHGKSLRKDVTAKPSAIVPAVVSHLSIAFTALKSIGVLSRYFI